MATSPQTTPPYLAAIDFGTTHCSVAYLIRPDKQPNPSEVDPTVLTLDEDGNRRIPSYILFDEGGNKIAFGQEAREEYAALDHEERSRYHYFEHVKKKLQHDKKIDRNQKISALNGKQFFLVDVIAHILHDLKGRLLTALKEDERAVKDGGKELVASDFDWVITVPAFWKDAGKRMMYEAGYMAGLCSDTEPPHICIATGNHSPPQEEKSPEKLSLALEPESAAIYCQRKAKVASKGKQFVARAEKYIIVDIGGGTVDIASHAIVEGRIVEIAPPAGNFWGGTTVNEDFSKFLQDFVEDPKFSRYTKGNETPDEQARHNADLTKLLYTTFEKEKKRFGSRKGGKNYNVEFPSTFVKKYKELLVKKGRELKSKGDTSIRIEDDGDEMRIDESKMAEFFQPAVDGIADLIKSHLEKHNITIDTIYWVGGFGGCEYLRNQLEKVIKEKIIDCQYRFPVPPEPEFAVIRGATAVRCDPNIIAERKGSTS